MRDNAWLKKQLDFLLKNYFSDVSITNPIEIKFGREAKYRFGSIRLYRNKKQETRNKKPTWKVQVPVDVVRYTMAHELCHYAHGFSSQNKRMFKYPHHGGIVNNELSERGAEDLIGAFKKWLKIYRKKILAGKISV